MKIVTVDPGSGGTPPTVAGAVKSLYDDLPESEVNTGILLDRLPFTYQEIKDRNGNSYADTTTQVDWELLHKQLRGAAYDAQDLKSLSAIKSDAAQTPEEVIPIGISYIDFNWIDFQAYEDYRLNFNGSTNKFERGSNAASPYNTWSYFAAAPLQASLGTDATFMFDQDFYVTNTNTMPDYFRIDFGDGQGFRRVDWGDQVSVSYANMNPKRVRLKAVENSQTLGKTSFLLYAGHQTLNLDPDERVTRNVPVSDYDGLDDPLNYMYALFNDEGDESIENPVVIMDGFDYGDAIGGIEPADYEDIYHRFNQPVDLSDGTKGRLADELRQDGHDVITLNYANGTGSIQHNAFALVDLIENVIRPRTNDRDQITVIGFSMGGLVTRYALSYMETKGIDHNMRLFISYDSPQGGANIPVGLQEFMKYPTRVTEQGKTRGIC